MNDWMAARHAAPSAVLLDGAALAEATAGKPVSVPSTTPYGCSVKY